MQRTQLHGFFDEMEKIGWAALIPAALRIGSTIASVGGALLKKKKPKLKMPKFNPTHTKPLGS